MLLCSQFQHKYGGRIERVQKEKGKNEILFIKQIHIAILHNFLDEMELLSIVSLPLARASPSASKFVVYSISRIFVYISSRYFCIYTHLFGFASYSFFRCSNSL